MIAFYRTIHQTTLNSSDPTLHYYGPLFTTPDHRVLNQATHYSTGPHFISLDRTALKHTALYYTKQHQKTL